MVPHCCMVSHCSHIPTNKCLFGNVLYLLYTWCVVNRKEWMNTLVDFLEEKSIIMYFIYMYPGSCKPGFHHVFLNRPLRG